MFERFKHFDIQPEPHHLDFAVGGYVQYGQPAKGGHVLVLLADGLFQDVQLDVAGLFGKLLGAHGVLRERMHRVQ